MWNKRDLRGVYYRPSIPTRDQPKCSKLIADTITIIKPPAGDGNRKEYSKFLRKVEHNLDKIVTYMDGRGLQLG